MIKIKIKIADNPPQITFYKNMTVKGHTDIVFHVTHIKGDRLYYKHNKNISIEFNIGLDEFLSGLKRGEFYYVKSEDD